MHTVRMVIGSALALALSGISILCCFEFGRHLAPGNEGTLYGALGAVADALKAALPIGITAAFAARQRVRALTGMLLFATFSAYSFASELGLYALSRDAQSSTVTASKESFELLKGERKRLAERLKALGETRPTGTIKADIAAQRQNKLWVASSQCAEANTNAARTFCASLERLAGELAAGEEAERLRVDDGKFSAKLSGIDLAAVMRSADPQSEALARFTGLTPSTMRDGLAVLLALLIELGSGFGLWAVTAAGEGERKNPQESKTAAPQQPGPAPTKSKAKDPVKAFARAVVVDRASGEVTAAELHNAFVEWAKREGLQEMSPTALGRKLSEMGYARVKRGGRSLYTGIALAAGSRMN